MNSTTTSAARPTVRPATPADATSVRALLRDASLPTAGVPDDLAAFLVAELTDGAGTRRLVGAVGLELYGGAALLRSAVVDPALRGARIGEALVHAVLDFAKAQGVVDLVLLTTTAQDWFPRFGFVRIARDEVPAALHASEELRGACPASAIVMRRRLDAAPSA